MGNTFGERTYSCAVIVIELTMSLLLTTVQANINVCNVLITCIHSRKVLLPTEIRRLEHLTKTMTFISMVPVLLLTITLSKVADAFPPHRITRRIKTPTLLQMVKIGPRKQLFFEIVESGLNDRFPERNEIERVFTFCKYATSELPKPKPLGLFHDPCEEFVENLTALPWWDPSKFSWVSGLEAQSKVMAEELKFVLSEQEAFKGDSRYQNTMGDGWTAFRLQRLGEWNEENVKVFPKTTEIIRSLDIPLAVRGVMFAKQLPGTPHPDLILNLI